MLSRLHQKILFWLSALASVLTFIVAGYSLLDPSVYPPNTPEQFIPGALSQDIVSLLAACGLLVCIRLIYRGWQSVWLIWVGLLGYLLYAYALYSFDRVYNPLFLGYIAILGLTLYALLGFFGSANLTLIHIAPIHRPPRKATAILFLGLTALFVSLWLSILIPAMITRIPPPGNSIFVLDLSFTLPLLLTVAKFLWKGKQMGDVLVIPLLIKMSMLGLSVLAGTLLAPAFGQAIALTSVLTYSILGLGPLLLIWPFFSSVKIIKVS